jgi:hypothetical protein
MRFTILTDKSEFQCELPYAQDEHTVLVDDKDIRVFKIKAVSKTGHCFIQGSPLLELNTYPHDAIVIYNGKAIFDDKKKKPDYN